MLRPVSDSAKKSLAPQIRAVLAEAFGKEMADRIIVGSCNILTIDQEDLFGNNFDMFVSRMEMVIPSLIGLKPGAAVVKRLWRLQDETVA